MLKTYHVPRKENTATHHLFLSSRHLLMTGRSCVLLPGHLVCLKCHCPRSSIIRCVVPRPDKIGIYTSKYDSRQNPCLTDSDQQNQILPVLMWNPSKEVGQRCRSETSFPTKSLHFSRLVTEVPGQHNQQSMVTSQ